MYRSSFLMLLIIHFLMPATAVVLWVPVHPFLLSFRPQPTPVFSPLCSLLIPGLLIQAVIFCCPSSLSVSATHLPHSTGSSPRLPTLSFTHSFTLLLVPFCHGSMSSISCGIIFNYLLTLVLHAFLIHVFIFFSSSSDTVLPSLIPFCPS